LPPPPRSSWHRYSALLLLLLAALSCRAPAQGPAPPPAATAAADDDPIAAPSSPGDLLEDPGHDPPQVQAEARPPRSPPKPVADRDAALAALAAGNYEGARDYFFNSNWIRAHPEDHPAHLVYAAAQAALGRYDEAEAALAPFLKGKDRLQKDPDGASALTCALARLRRLRGDDAGAESLLRAVLAANPHDLPARGDLLALWVATGRGADPEARAAMDALYDAYDAGRAKHAQDLLAVAQAALARGTSGAFHDANMVLGEAERAPVRGPEPEQLVRDRALLLRGAIFHEKYAAQEAAATYGLVLQRDPWQPDALGALALLQVDELRLAAAARLADAALSVNPRQPAALAALARIAVIEGRRADAQGLAAELAEIDPDADDRLAVLAALALTADDRPTYEAHRARALARTRVAARFAVTLSELLVSMHLYPEAGEVLREVAARAPDDPRVNSAHGLNLLRLGDEAAGRAALTRAWRRDRFNERTRNTLDLYDQRIDRDYTELDRPGLRLRLPTADHEHIAPELIAAFERARVALDRRYGALAEPLRLEVFSDPQDFSIRTVGVPSLGAVGVCFGPVITMVGPYQGTHNADQVIWHELAHVYAIRLSRGRVPRWFTEGLSEWESELADPAWARESAELLKNARERGALRRLGELELAFLRADSGAAMEVAYTTAAYAIRYLGETYGHPPLLEILRGYGRGQHTPELFERHLGRPFAVIEADFEKWLKGQIDERIQGWAPSRDREPKKKEIDPRDRLYQRVLLELRGGDADAAARTLQELLQSGGDGYSPRMALAQILLAGPAWQGAEPHLQRARQLHREATEPLVRLSELARRRGDLEAEKQHLSAALDLDGGSFDPAARLVLLALISDDAPRLARARARAAAIAPLHPLTLAARAHALALAGDLTGAQRLHRRALAATPQSGPADTLVVMALAAAAVGDRASAQLLATRARSDAKLPQRALAALDAALSK
jgi:tetratricopeptide (TPR) repeat protein